MTAQVFFVVAEAKDVLVVPMSALTIQRGAGRGKPWCAQQVGPSAPSASSPTPATPSGATPAPTATGQLHRQRHVVPARRPSFPTLPSRLWPTRWFAQARWRKPVNARAWSREAFQNMSEEERARFREQRRKAREQAQAAGGNAAAAPAASTAPTASCSHLQTPAARKDGQLPRHRAAQAQCQRHPAQRRPHATLHAGRARPRSRS